MTFDRSWQARWIWLGQATPPPATMFNLDPLRRPADTVARLRRSFELGSVPDEAPCRLTADGHYQVFVNGERIGRGPVRSEPSHLAWDAYDLAPLLRPGTNTIAVLVRHFGTTTMYWKPAHPAGEVGFGGLLLEANCGDVTIATDSSWRASIAPYAQADPGRWAGPPATEIFDARNDEPDWALPDFDDTHWDSVRTLAPMGLAQHSDAPPFDPFGMLDRAEIGQLAERMVEPRRIVGRSNAFKTRELAPIDCLPLDGVGRLVDEPMPDTLALNVSDSVTLDFQELTNAHPIIEVEATAGTIIDIAVGEDLDATGAPVIRPRRWLLRFIASGNGVERLEALEPVGFRYLQVMIRHGEVRSLRSPALYRHYPRPKGPSFHCDDPTLDELWRVGAQTLDACSTDAFLDCPGREQRAWVGDAYVESLVSLVCNPDTDLVTHNAELLRQGVRTDGLRPMVGGGDFSDSSVTIPDFSLHWIRTIARVHEHLDDLDFVERMWPRILDALSWFEWHRGEDDLLVDLTGWIFVDWAQTERGRHIAAADAFYALTLQDAAMMADQLGDSGTARRLRARADRSCAAMERYWDDERGAYVDAASPDGWTGRRISQQTNVLAILSGAAPRDRWPRMLERILDEERLLMTRHPGDGGPELHRLMYQWMTAEPFGGGTPMDEEEQVVMAQPFFCHFLHQALAEAEAFDALFTSMRRWQPLVERGDQVLQEYWDHTPGHGSRCHAWSATPTWDLTTHVAGVRRRGVGWSEVDIEPHLGPLQFVEAVVPTPRGEIRVELRAGEDGTIILPEGVSGTFRVGGVEVELTSGKQTVALP